MHVNVYAMYKYTLEMSTRQNERNEMRRIRKADPCRGFRLQMRRRTGPVTSVSYK